MSFAQALPGLLAERGMSLRSLAVAIGVSPSHLSRGVRGAAEKSLRSELVSAAADALGLPPEHFPEVREAAVIDAVRRDAELRDRVFRGLRDIG